MKFLGMGLPEFSIIFVGLLIALVFGYFAQKFGGKKGYGDAGCFAAGFFLGIIGLIVILLLPDKNEGKKTTAEDLMSYKNLLDSGAITQEEFDAKKKELL